jgi:ATP-dependent Clp protease ATP-binding subunit ClpA
MSQRYLPDRKLPDKAIDLVDEAVLSPDRARQLPVEPTRPSGRGASSRSAPRKWEKEAGGKARRPSEEEIAESDRAEAPQGALGEGARGAEDHRCGPGPRRPIEEQQAERTGARERSRGSGGELPSRSRISPRIRRAAIQRI